MTRHSNPHGAVFCRDCPWRAGLRRDLGCKAGFKDKSHG